MILPFKEVLYINKIPRGVQCILGADIGGTNSNFGVFTTEHDKLKLIISIHFKSQEIKIFSPITRDVLLYLKKTYDITVAKACIACAGIALRKKSFIKPTNLDFSIDAREIRENTGLDTVLLANDFEVIGYGLHEIASKDLVLINKGDGQQHANKAILGAGTGLGKSILIWDRKSNRYRASASEGGHADFAVQSRLELDLISFITETEKRINAISWEDLLSGNGIQRIYRFFKKCNGRENGDTQPHPDEIFKSRMHDKNSWDTFALYTTLYARCAKNFALDALALGGIYIAGGIAAKNVPLFEMHSFMDEFINCGKQKKLLQSIPLWIITDYNVSLYGAASYLLLEETRK